jgi:hypothetical protein
MFCARQDLKIAKGKENGILVVMLSACWNSNAASILADELGTS